RPARRTFRRRRPRRNRRHPPACASLRGRRGGGPAGLTGQTVGLVAAGGSPAARGKATGEPPVATEGGRCPLLSWQPAARLLPGARRQAGRPSPRKKGRQSLLSALFFLFLLIPARHAARRRSLDYLFFLFSFFLFPPRQRPTRARAPPAPTQAQLATGGLQ